MKTFLVTAAALALLTITASAGFTAADISKLPQDKVEAVKQLCAQRWGDRFTMRQYCEDNEYQALQDLIARGSVQAK